MLTANSVSTKEEARVFISSSLWLD